MISAGDSGVRLEISRRYLAAFASLLVLCGMLHMLAHHLAGAALCGCFGHETITHFELCGECGRPRQALFAARWAGALLSYGLMWLGAHQLKQAPRAARQFGFALVFSNLPIHRITFALLGVADEQVANAEMFGGQVLVFGLTNLFVWLLATPPCIRAYLAIHARHRWPWFGGFFVLPFLFFLSFCFLVEDQILMRFQFAAHPVLGVPLLVILVGVLSFVVFLSCHKVFATT